MTKIIFEFQNEKGCLDSKSFVENALNLSSTLRDSYRLDDKEITPTSFSVVADDKTLEEVLLDWSPIVNYGFPFRISNNEITFAKDIIKCITIQ